MNYQNPPLQGQAKNTTYDYESAAKKDARLQADLELASSEGRATFPAVAVYFSAMVFIVCVVLWGLNHQRDETVTNASAPAAEAPAADNAAAPPAPVQQPNSQQRTQGGPNPPPNQKQPQQNPPPAQQQAKQSKQQPAQQQAPAPKQ